MPLTRAQRNAAAGGQEGDAPAEQASSQAPARRAFGAVDNQRKGKRKAAAKKEPAREVRDRVRASSRPRARTLFPHARALADRVRTARFERNRRSPLRANRANHAPKTLRRP